jgi:hypothetical protein
MRTLLFAPLIMIATGFPAYQAAAQNVPQRNSDNYSLLSFQETAESTIEPRVQRVSLRDAGAHISELRVGGETREIVVTPTSGLPAYDVVPYSAARGMPTAGTRDANAGLAGQRMWNLSRF